MPIYEYRCASCGHELESLQKLSDAPLVRCPACHADALVKKVSAAGFQLKGSGWYATDFRNSGKAPAKPEAKPAGEAKAGDTTPAADAGDKPAAKPASTSDAAPAAAAPAAPAPTPQTPGKS